MNCLGENTSKKEKDVQRRKAKGNIAAEWSFIFVLVSIILNLLPPLLPPRFSMVCLTGLRIVAPLAVIFGIIGIYKIKKSKGELGGVVPSLCGIIIGTAVVTWIATGGIEEMKSRMICYSPRMVCGTNISGLGRAMLIYSNEYGKYPTPDKWCDLLMEHADATEKTFLCYGAVQNGDEGPCHYAINPHCQPNSNPEMVLLFEANGSWNKFGGVELLTFVNHKGYGCNVLFNDGRVEFVSPAEVVELRWTDERGERIEEANSVEE
ncbi:MAG: hypothetical protein JSV99_09905 [Planctomycetota bacterium]|nr:MAG: hypothetical protein JSV99_09905 [Planctomycetota bacterium]